METYANWLKLIELQRYYSWIVDRFHPSARMYPSMTYNKDYDFRWLEERLLPRNFGLVMLTRSPETFAAARAERLRVSGNPSQDDNLDLFVEEQKLIAVCSLNRSCPASSSTFRITTFPRPWSASPIGWNPPAGYP